MMKRAILLLMLVLMVSSVVTAEEPVVVKFATWIPEYQEKYDEIFSDFLKENPNIEVEVTLPASTKATDYMKKTDLMLMSGDDVDIVMHANIAEHIERTRKGLFEPLNSYFQKEGISYSDAYKSGFDYEGKYYGIPADVKFWFILLNKDHLDEAGLPVPPLDWTWDDYAEYAEKLTKGEGYNKRYGSFMQNWGLFGFPLWYTVEGTSLVTNDDVLNFNRPEFKDFLKLRYDMENIEKSETPHYEIVAQKLYYRDVFFNEKASMIPMGSWMVQAISDVEKYPHDFVTAFAPMPRPNDKVIPNQTKSDVHLYGINKNSKNKEAAYKVLRHITTKGTEVILQGFSTSVDADNDAIIEKMMNGREDLYHLDSLEKVITTRKANLFDYFPEYYGELSSIMNEETERYLLQDQTLEECIDNLMSRGQKLIDEYK